MATEISSERYEGQLSVVMKGRELNIRILCISKYTRGRWELKSIRNSGPLKKPALWPDSTKHGFYDFLESLEPILQRLSGKIPTSNQFQTFNDPSIYRNNLALCGEPLAMKCPGDDEATTDSSGVDNEDHDDEHEDAFEMKWFYMSMGPGFVVGFWGVFGPLIINRSWRRAYFRFLDEMKDRVMVVITESVAWLQKKCK
ncbi:hypothetical protein CK203_015174 [Vitis vinifera]|uniref:Uncharacterized protein n=1 Tax=Vitis vinifera TaxID=29760 RepID=A0A438JD10_VITVI|nr:hypothetical protein CK203_015174 [Vitis vinifera]